MGALLSKAELNPSSDTQASNSTNKKNKYSEWAKKADKLLKGHKKPKSDDGNKKYSSSSPNQIRPPSVRHSIIDNRDVQTSDAQNREDATAAEVNTEVDSTSSMLIGQKNMLLEGL